jgi:hypothetical protein
MRRLVHLLVLAVFAFTLVATAQQQDSNKAAENPLVRLLQSKGVITEQEAATINQAGSPEQQQQALSKLLVSKGIISQDEYKQAATTTAPPAQDDSGALVPATAHVAPADPMPPSLPAGPPDQKGPAVIPAVAPIRVLQSEPAKPGGLIPDLKLGSGARIKVYGFLKATTQYDTSDPQNLDFVLPGFGSSNGFLPQAIPSGGNSGFSAIPGLGNSDTGPYGDPQFRVEARQSRVGMNFEWPDLAGSKNTLTGRLEADFEGNFSRAQNRSVSTGRTNMFVLRLAWMRIDHKVSDATTLFTVIGMDWTPFASSTLPNLLETTGLGVYFGNPYERAMQFRGGIFHDFGGSRHFSIGIEPAVVAPLFGNLPGDVAVQLGVGERQGFDSAVPEIQGRIYFQWQLDKARGVAPAQIIFSGTHATRAVEVTHGSVADAFCGAAKCGATVLPSLADAFPHGAQTESTRYGVTAEIQLPTRYLTLVAKAYNGEDLKFYFANQIFSFYNNNSLGLLGAPTGTACTRGGGGCPVALNQDASSAIAFGWNPALNAGAGGWQAIPQNPVRTDGWFSQLAFPLSRIFNANPEGRNAGWTVAFTYGIDEAKARDVRVAAPTGGRAKSDMSVATLYWKLNQYVTFGYETSLYRTFSTCSAASAVLNGSAVDCPGTIFRGVPARAWHDFRNQFGPTFTF